MRLDEMKPQQPMELLVRLRRIAAIATICVAISGLTTCSSDDKSSGPVSKNPPFDFISNPEDGSDSVSVVGSIYAVFGTKIDCSSITSETVTLSTVEGVDSECDGDTISILPGKPLEYNTYYTATVGAGAKYSDGSLLGEDRSWSFETRSVPGDRWHVVDLEIPSAQGLTEIAYSGNEYVAVGDNGKIIRSEDGFQWYVVESPATVNFWSIVWADGMFVAVGDREYIVTSPDGTGWVERRSTSYMSRSLQDVIHDGSRFVAVGGHKTQSPNEKYIADVRVSIDGINWVHLDQTLEGRIKSIVFTGVEYVAAGEMDFQEPHEAAIWRSYDLIHWTSEISDVSQNFGYIDISYSGDLLLAIGVGPEGTILTSSDGREWTSLQLSNDAFAVTWTGSLFATTGPEGDIYLSQDGVDWIHKTTQSSRALYGIWGTPDFLIAVGGSFIFRSL